MFAVFVGVICLFDLFIVVLICLLGVCLGFGFCLDFVCLL